MTDNMKVGELDLKLRERVLIAGDNILDMYKLLQRLVEDDPENFSIYEDDIETLERIQSMFFNTKISSRY